MSYIADRDPLRAENARKSSAARDWYALIADHIGAEELPMYGRALRIRVSDTATPPLTLVVVPIDEQNDEATRTVIVDQTEVLPYGVRRIVSLNGGGAIPTGINIDVIAK